MKQKKSIEERIEEVLEKVRPSIKMHGGNVELLDFDSKFGIVTVQLSGACHGCPMSNITLKNIILSEIQQKIPEVKEIINKEDL